MLRDVESRLYVKYTFYWRLPLSNYILLININFASRGEQVKHDAVLTLADERILKQMTSTLHKSNSYLTYIVNFIENTYAVVKSL